MSQSILNLTEFATYGLDQLMNWAAARNIPFGFERSVRCSPVRFETRRALYSFAKEDFGLQALELVLQQARTMNAPDRLLQSLSQFFFAAAHVHFGFECSGETKIGKCYLELPGPSVDTPPVAGRLQFLGFKWSMNDRSVTVVTRYRSLGASTWQDVERLMLQNTDATSRPVLAALLNEFPADSSANEQTFQLLEIEEEGSDRRSYDLNVYDQQRSVHDLISILPQIAAAFELQLANLESWAGQFASAPLGHIATGLGRNGQPFLTLYHGNATNTSHR